MGASPSPILCFQASACWRLNGSTDCGIPTDKTDPVLLHLGTKAAVPYSFEGGSFRKWIGTAGENVDSPNYLGILTLGWCYILSAGLVELQGDGASMRYTECTAMGCGDGVSEDPAANVIDIGAADEDVSRWWAALLAPGEGWKAVGEFLAPWSVAYAGAAQRYCIAWRRSGALRTASTPVPLSSRQAFEALARFALSHNAGRQFLVALATAITVPSHNWHGSAVRLPPPASTHSCVCCPAGAATQSIPPEWAVLHEHLPYYMSLSCHPDALMSSLCGTFWQADVPCTLASPWLHLILTEVREGCEPDHYAEILAIIGGIRRPSISALWLGAAAGGLVPMVIRRVRRGRPPLDPVVSPWTGCAQSFMEGLIRGSYADAQPTDWIWRADVWRLLHLPVVEADGMSYAHPPRTPWEPCGRMRVKDCALRVVAHLTCGRHEFRYHCWAWELEGGEVVHDLGFSAVEQPASASSSVGVAVDVDGGSGCVPDSGPFPSTSCDLEASLEASLEVFRWFVINGEGVPAETLYRDAWLEGLDDDVESEEAVAEDEGGPSSC
ncbi:hypothetical protein BP00DRAFT_488680 [Aspergillus indologenus CBS 114.80]|uniref:Uncharacterized protein n=1 Tax=Aspergillus indologenus CBS 114.80 TaxID=1450541 RepID=A0A2V5HVP8_9EURO|nr:hypothetical protein BP00DRAFT_488680 [Aspergillus indologenus CBS 114.80]